MSGGVERRGRTRFELDTAILVRVGDDVWQAECVNASMSGAMLDGRRGGLSLTHTCGAERLVVECDIVVVRHDPGAGFPKPFRLGVRLVDLDTETSIRLFNLLRMQPSAP